MHSIFNIATAYAERGWAVFPCRGKEPLTLHGFKDASHDPEQIRKWWSVPPRPPARCDVAIATGAVSGIIVLDIDVKNGGLESLEHLKKEFGHDAFYTYTVKTGGGGYHFYFKHPGYHIGNRVGIRPGVDLRADGGYVVAPPSLHDSGHEYETVTDLPILDCHEKLLALANPLPKDTFLNKKILGGDLADTIGEGGRNNYLTKLSGRLQRSGLSPEAIMTALMEENERRCNPPLPPTEVAAIAKWISKYQAQDPVLAKVDHNKKSLVIRAQDLIPEMLKYLRNKDLVRGQATGLDGLDKLLGGGKRLGEVTAWQAEAKTGKNTFWHALMYIWAQSMNIPIGYASRELSPETEVLPNILSLHFQKNIWLSDVEDEAYLAAVSKWPIYFAQGYGYMSYDEIEAWVMECKTLGINYFWFDHLHYMIEEPEEHKEASKLIKLLKTLAKRENVHIDIIIQPNKLSDDTKKLSLHTMKGGAAIGQAVDNVIVLERMKGDGIEPNTIRLELAAGRSKLCRLGEIYLKFNPDTTDFVEIEYKKERPPPLNKQWTRPSNFVRPKQPII